jgi:xanthine dehydrogenase accessory factor
MRRLQPVTRANRFLSLVEVHDALLKRQAGLYFQRIPQTDQNDATRFEPGDINRTRRAELIEQEDAQWLVTPAHPPIHLLIAGAGLDAQPLAALAHNLGWQITLWDPRVKPDRRNNFPHCDQVISAPVDRLDILVQEGLDAAILMTHNTALDAVALSRLHSQGLGYLAMIGPQHRRAQVLEEAGLSEKTLDMPLAGPAGLDLGTTLPETIALSILAECQAVLNHTDAHSLSDRFAQEIQ